MRKLLAACAVALSLCAAQAQAAVTSIVAASGTNATGAEIFIVTGSCAAGQVAVVIAGTIGTAGVTALSDSSGNTWTAGALNRSNTPGVRLYKSVLTSPIVGGSTLTMSYTGTPTWNGMVADCVTDGTAIPTANDGGANGGGSGGVNLNQSVSGVTAAPAYQFAAYVVSNGNGASTSSSGWTSDQSLGTTAGMHSYYRVAANTTASSLQETTGGVALWTMGWTEVTQGGGGGGGATAHNLMLLGVGR